MFKGLLKLQLIVECGRCDRSIGPIDEFAKRQKWCSKNEKSSRRKIRAFKRPVRPLIPVWFDIEYSLLASVENNVRGMSIGADVSG
jgi:hypothetical protein